MLLFYLLLPQIVHTFKEKESISIENISFPDLFVMVVLTTMPEYV